MILEGIVTTLNDDDTVNISPMGPEVDAQLETLVLKPYQTSTTYRNLKRNGQGVFHVTDDVELLAQAAVGTPAPLPPMRPAEAVEGRILTGSCRWYAFRVGSLDDRQERTRIACNVIDRGTLREFFGFNRGKHAVVEAAVLATRVDFLPAAEILAEFDDLRVLVDKTGGPTELRAFEFLSRIVRERTARAAR
ncbi:MAG: DUF447 family protein [Planctomycetota bacterium]|nr:MAG: DUF447 family protein [Planctomycetota bacterium]